MIHTQRKNYSTSKVYVLKKDLNIVIMSHDLMCLTHLNTQVSPAVYKACWEERGMSPRERHRDGWMANGLK